MPVPKRPAKRSFATTHYIDDSGEEAAPFTLMGGPIFSQRGSFAFHYEWSRITDLHNVKLPIHMRDFARPKRKSVLGVISPTIKRAIHKIDDGS
jgi:hypothetical protein